MNFFDFTIPQQGETFSTLLNHPKVKIVRIVSSDELGEKEYIQEEDEWVLLLEGEAKLLLNRKEVTLKKGDSLFIPALIPHQVLSAQMGTLWIALHIYI